jgi:hypothetical protein
LRGEGRGGGEVFRSTDLASKLLFQSKKTNIERRLIDDYHLLCN